MVEGQGGIGKTWIMKELLGRIRSGNISFIKEIERSTIFIASTDVNRPGSSLNDISGSFTLYDLYVAAVSGRQTQGQTATPIEEETFYNALKIGNLVVFVDGLDEVIARRRGSFDPDLFFGNLQEMMKGGSNAKVIISCRTIFFDQFEYVMKFPSVQTYELLAFDKALRDRYLQDSLGTLPNKVNRARQISEELAVLPDTKRYVPFVLSLIVEIMIEEADDPASSVEGGFKNYFSERLLQSEYSDRVIGQFCEREIKKVGDKFRCLTVDQQVDVFCGLARMNEGDNGRADSKVVTKLIREATGLRSVGDLTDTFLSHPFLVVTKIGADSIVSIRFDFMTEQFLMLGLSEVLLADPNDETEPSHTLTVLDVLIFNKYCSANSIMCRGLSLRLGSDSDVFGLNIIGFHFTGERLIEQELEDSESNILKPGSAASQFSYSLISLIVAQMSLKGDLSTEALTKMLIDIFSSSDKTISRMAIIDGVHTGDRRFRLDFRGLTFVECLFHSIDIWSCQFDEASNFQRCRFISCDGIRSRDSGITENTFDMNCVFDEVFERVFAKGQTRVVDAQEKVKTDILSFVSDFYSSGRFEDFTEDYIAKHYSRTNPTVPIKKMIQAFKRNGVLVRNPRKRDTYWHMVADDAKASIERLVTQGVLSGSLKKIAQDLC